MKDLKDILDKLLKDKVPGYRDKARQFEVFDAWDKAVGEQIAKNCWPERFLDADTLLVASQSSAWLQQLKYLESDILNKLESELKERRVKRLRFKIGTYPGVRR